jgi:hypothetical protein
MSREETKKLLGGYATGTLTPEEQQALFAAALEDQELFDALASEQSLRDLMRDPAAKAQMLAALDGHASPGGWMEWMRRPWVAGLVAAGLAAVGVTVWRTKGGGTVVQREAAPMAAQVKPEPTPPAVDAVSPAPKVEERQIIASARPDNRRRESAAATTPVAPLTPPPATSAPAAGSRDAKDAQVAAAERKPAEPDAAKERVQAASNSQTAQAAPTPSPMNFSMNGSQQNGQQNVAPSPSQQAVQLYDQRILSNSYAPPAGAGGGMGPGGAKAELALRAAAPPLALNLKFAIIRASNVETDLSTALDRGEGVKLRIVPNAPGFLYVFEGGTSVVSAQVTGGQQFETPELKSNGAGRRQFRVIFTREAIASGVAGDFAASPRTKSAIVPARNPVPQPQLEQMVTLTWK